MTYFKETEKKGIEVCNIYKLLLFEVLGMLMAWILSGCIAFMHQIVTPGSQR